MKGGQIAGAAGLLVTLLAIGGGLAYWKYTSIAAAAAAPRGPEPSEAVSMAKVGYKTWTPTARLVGSVFALQSVVLSNEVAGIVKQVQFDSGMIVDAGAVLLQLDSATEEADLAAALATERVAAADVDVASAEVRSAEAAVKLTQSDVRRLTQAVESKAAAESTLDRAQADLEQANAKLVQMKSGVVRANAAREQAAAKVQQLRVLLEKKTLRAPFRCRVGIRSVHPGQYLAENTQLVELQGIADTTYLDFAIPQDQAFRVVPGMVYPAKSEALGSGTVNITVQAVDTSVDRSTRNVRIRTVVANPKGLLLPGTYVDVEVPMGMPEKRLVIPAVSVRRSSFGDHVFVIEPGKEPGQLRAHQRFIKLGASFEGDVVVESGLKEGEMIAATGSFKLREDVLVMDVPAGGEKAPDGLGGGVRGPAAQGDPAKAPEGDAPKH